MMPCFFNILCHDVFTFEKELLEQLRILWYNNHYKGFIKMNMSGKSLEMCYLCTVKKTYDENWFEFGPAEIPMHLYKMVIDFNMNCLSRCLIR